MALRDKQAAFVEHYLTTFNATQAAKDAGYSEKTAYSIGHENLKKPEIAEVISKRLQEKAMSADEVMMRLADQGRGDIADFWELPEDGEPRLNLSGVRAEGKTHLIRKLKVKTTRTMTEKAEIETTETEVELYNAQAAQRLIGQHHGLFVDRVEHSGKVGVEIVKGYIGINPDEWDADGNTD